MDGKKFLFRFCISLGPMYGASFGFCTSQFGMKYFFFISHLVYTSMQFAHLFALGFDGFCCHQFEYFG